MGAQFTSEEIILGQKAETITTSKIYITDTSEARRKKKAKKIFFIFLLSKQKNEKNIFPYMNIDSGKRERKRRNFLYHQMSGAEYKWKV
jgi:hypothetical protein